MFDTQEVLMVGALITVKKDTVFPDRYKGVFHGKTEVPRGRYVYWYPIKNTTYSRMVNELQRWYGVSVEYGIAGTAEI